MLVDCITNTVALLEGYSQFQGLSDRAGVVSHRCVRSGNHARRPWTKALKPTGESPRWSFFHRTAVHSHRRYSLNRPRDDVFSRHNLDHIVFWNAADLEKKLTEFRAYYNECRVHSSLGGHTPGHFSGERANRQAVLRRSRWQTHCRGLYQLPVAA